jgi:hypothetical protein
MEVLAYNKDTDDGRRYGFAGIKTAEQFRAALPVTTYDDYAPLIALMGQLAERNIYTADTIICYMLSFGADGSARFIPCTQKYMDLFTIGGGIEELGKILVPGPIFMLNASFPKVRRFNDGLYLNSLSGMLLATYMKEIFGDKKKKERRNPFFFFMELVMPEGLYDYRYANILFALANKDVRMIVSPYQGMLMDSFQFIKENWETLTDDIERGTIGKYIDTLPEKIKKKLAVSMNPDPGRAAELRAIFAEGFDRPLIHRIWPHLALIVAEMYDVNATPESRANESSEVKQYIGNVPIHNGPYFAPEALIGSSVPGGTNEYTMLPYAGFFEFAPVRGGIADREHTVFMNELEIGGEYGLVVTNCLGFYRYDLGDIIKVLRMNDAVPVISIVRRNSIATHFTSEGALERVMETVMRELKPDERAHI